MATFSKTPAKAVLQLIVAAGVEGLIGAGRHGRGAERATRRNSLPLA